MPPLRIGDQEREAATTRLGEHYAAGRIDNDEHAERLDAIWSARTAADLDLVFWDLPQQVVGATPAAPPPRRRSIPWLPLLIAAVVVLALVELPFWVALVGLLVFLKMRHHRRWGHRPRHGGPHALRPARP